MNHVGDSPLGRPASYPDHYNPGLLFPIPRAPARAELGLESVLPFFGADMWTAFELSWLNLRGKPQLALAHVTVPCESTNIIESKSLKLYLNSFSQAQFEGVDEVLQTLRRDLGEAVSRESSSPTSVGVRLLSPAEFNQQQVHELDGLSLDRLDAECTEYSPAPERLRASHDESPVTEVLTSNLLRSNCPVTGQPDWGSVQIGYSGAPIDQEGLLRYLVSFRNHTGFHEQCVERIFMDLWRRCRPVKLTVFARYTRRGGLDINPFRTSHPLALPANVRTARQ